MTLGHSDDVDHLVLGKHLANKACQNNPPAANASGVKPHNKSDCTLDGGGEGGPEK